MRSIKKQTRGLSLTLVGLMIMTAFTFIGGLPTEAYGAKYEQIPSTMKVIYYPKSTKDNLRGEEKILTNPDYWYIDMKTVKSSNPKVASLKCFMSEPDGISGIPYYYVSTKKAGKATLTFKAKAYGSSKFVKKKIKVTSVKHTAVVKKLTVGKKNYTNKLKNKQIYCPKGNIKGKVTIKAKSGWKIKKIEKLDLDTSEWKTIKNKSSITLKKDNEGGEYGEKLKVTFVKKKNKGIIEYAIIDMCKYGKKYYKETHISGPFE